MTATDVDAFTVYGTKLFAGTTDGGVFLTTNNGATWIGINGGLLATNVWSLGILDTNLFAGTTEGVWRRPLPDFVVSAEELTNQLPTCFSLYQNYPNPFNPTTRIKFQIADFEFVNLKVYDALGNEISTLVNEQKPAGNYQVEFNGTDLPSGIYFYQLKAGNPSSSLRTGEGGSGQGFVETKKMVLLK